MVAHKVHSSPRNSRSPKKLIITIELPGFPRSDSDSQNKGDRNFGKSTDPELTELDFKFKQYS